MTGGGGGGGGGAERRGGRQSVSLAGGISSSRTMDCLHHGS